jgi:hypothetical protein
MKADKNETSNYKGIPAMSPPEVHQYLKEIGQSWTGAGAAVEVGSWLGATSAALLDGLVEAGYDRPFWAFDRWRANESEVRKAAEWDVRLTLHQDLLPSYIKSVSKIYPNLQTIKGKVPWKFHSYSGDPMEVCLFDAPKRNPVFDDCIRFCEPHFIPGVTVLGLMDYYFYRSRRDVQENSDWKKFLAPVAFIEKFSDHFTLLREFPENGSCAFFRYEKPIPWKH